ncbi:MAG: hypothetical protein HYV97_02955 [Bdellovibrio sp.]|nr:hypothetical protein [Bdellovibrio sp.]
MAFKFDDLIAKVKSQIPPNLLGKIAPKKDSGDGEGEATNAATRTGTKSNATMTGSTQTDAHEKTQSKTQTKTHGTSSKVDGTAPDGKPPVDAKAAKRSKIIKIGVGIAIVFFAADEFLNTEQPAESTPPATVVKNPKKEKQQEEPPKPIETPAAEQAQATPSPVSTPTPVAEVATPTPDPIAEVATPAPTPEVVPTEVPQQTQAEVPVGDEKVPDTVATVPDSVPESNTVDRTPSGGTDTQASTANSDVTAFQVGETVPVDQVKDPTVSEGTMDKVVEQLDKQKSLEYVSPPTYEELGRGLVYNCKGQHWACINKDAYFVCRDNMKWNATHSKPKECITVNVYATNEDCEMIQLHNINTREKTDFCK